MLIGELAAAIVMSLTYVVMGALMLLELVLAAAAFLLELIVRLVSREGSTAKRSADGISSWSATVGVWRKRLAGAVRNRWVRRVGLASAACFILTVGVVLVLNFVFFDWTLRKLMDGASARSGIEVRYASAEGNLLTGRIRLADVTLVRRNHRSVDFNVRADEFAIDLHIWSTVRGRPRVEQTLAVGVRGAFDKRSAGESEAWHARRDVQIDRLVIRDANVAWIDHTRPRDGQPMRVPLEVEVLEAAELRTRWIAFDLLFRTNGSGSAAGRPFKVANQPTSNGGGRSVWQFDGLPVGVVGDYVGGPVAWLTAGTAGVSATTIYGDPGRPLEMDWRFDFVDVQAEVPLELNGWRGRLATAFVDHVNAHGDHLPVAFTFQLDRAGFDGGASAEAAGLWKAVADAATHEITRLLKVDPEIVEDLKSKTLDRLKALRRKPASE